MPAPVARAFARRRRSRSSSAARLPRSLRRRRPRRRRPAPESIAERSSPAGRPSAEAARAGTAASTSRRSWATSSAPSPPSRREPPPPPGPTSATPALADIFREFQKGVDKQLGKEDYETRYNLGIAYKEMGLVDEAIAEFQLAAKDETRLLECASMLGHLLPREGHAQARGEVVREGPRAPGRTDEEYQGLRYDLASALEQAGEVDRALALFTELYGQDASFRDVADKLRRLGDGP